MLRLIGVVVTIGVADSLNPTTIAPALFLASGENPRDRVFEYTLGVFAVYFLGGVAIALGPGQLLLSLVPHPSYQVRSWLEIFAGAALMIAGGVLWLHRNRLSKRTLPQPDAEGKTSWILGASITAVELPTAFPYFAAIAAIVGADVSPAHEVVLLVIFNLCFVLPLIAIVLTLWIAGDRAQEVLGRVRTFLQAHWPVILAMAALVGGLFVVFLGVSALLARSNSDLGTLARRLRHLIHLKTPKPPPPTTTTSSTLTG